MVKRDPAYKAERNRKIYEARLSGRTFVDISKEYGIGVERVRQIYLKEKRLEKRRRFIRRYGTLQNINDLQQAKERFYIFCKWRSRQITDEDKDLIQKIDNLIEVYSEEV